jgi:hypothetical protein
MNNSTSRYIPTDDAQRLLLHDEIHMRPSATIGLPALLVYVAVLNSEVSVRDEFAHLKQLPMPNHLDIESMKGQLFAN